MTTRSLITENYKKIVGDIDTKPPYKFWFCGFNLSTGLFVIAGYQVLWAGGVFCGSHEPELITISYIDY